MRSPEEEARIAAVINAVHNPALVDPAPPADKAWAFEAVLDALLEAGPCALSNVNADLLRIVMDALESQYAPVHRQACRLLWLILSGVRPGWDADYFPPLYLPSRQMPTDTRKHLRRIDRTLVEDLGFPFPIVPLLLSGEDNIVRHATASLSLILGRRGVPRFRERFQVLESALEALVANLVSEDQRVQLVSVSSLTSLVAHIATHNAVIDANGVENLATILHRSDSSSGLVRIATLCLRVLAQRSPLLVQTRLQICLPDDTPIITVLMRRLRELWEILRGSGSSTVAADTTSIVDCIIVLTAAVRDPALLEIMRAPQSSESTHILSLAVGILDSVKRLRNPDSALCETLSDLLLHLCVNEKCLPRILEKGGRLALLCALTCKVRPTQNLAMFSHDHHQPPPRTYACLYATDAELEQWRSRRLVFSSRVLAALCAYLTRMTDTSSTTIGATILVRDLVLPLLFDAVGIDVPEVEAHGALSKRNALRNTIRRAAVAGLADLGLREQWARCVFAFRNGAVIARLLALGFAAHAVCAYATKRREAAGAVGEPYDANEEALMHQANAAVLLHLVARGLSTFAMHDNIIDSQPALSKMLIDLWKFFALTSQDNNLYLPLPIALLASLNPELSELALLMRNGDDDDTDSTDENEVDDEDQKFEDRSDTTQDGPADSFSLNASNTENDTYRHRASLSGKPQKARDRASSPAEHSMGDRSSRQSSLYALGGKTRQKNVALEAAFVEASLGQALIQVGFHANIFPPQMLSAASSDQHQTTLTWTCKWFAYAETVLESYPRHEHIRAKSIALIALAIRRQGWIALWSKSAALRAVAAELPRDSSSVSAASLDSWPWDEGAIDLIVDALTLAATQGGPGGGACARVDLLQVSTMRVALRAIIELLQPAGFEREYKLLLHLKFAKSESLLSDASGNTTLHIFADGQPKHVSELELAADLAHNMPWGVAFTSPQSILRFAKVNKNNTLPDAPVSQSPAYVCLEKAGWTISLWMRHGDNMGGDDKERLSASDPDSQSVHVLAAAANGEFPVAVLSTCHGIELGCVELLASVADEADHFLDFIPSLFERGDISAEKDPLDSRPVWHGTGFALNEVSPGWHHLVVLCDGKQTRFFVDRAQAGDTIDFACTETSLESLGNSRDLAHAFLPDWTIADFRLYGTAIPYMTVVSSPVRAPLNRRPWDVCNAMDIAHEYARQRLAPNIVDALVAMIDVDVIEVRRYASEALLLLAAHDENLPRIIEAKAVPTLAKWSKLPVGLDLATFIEKHSHTQPENDAFLASMQHLACCTLVQVILKLR
ncbi:Hypothetical Protein FCC1311_095952 [Hondaea fermentalgiana]|uniref:Uncharacterized protein n=1 Tax=Hondaea fermentalgiana TaxID=2315210 RepID=A0A2R5GR70_9STRA|nr:Hypothetical Protein FCC1311_095952 [Hondaea fermentalgiana]|eukprot:GBG33372.1 Hypothetical Protein FCC1311_095952 [Hondaea fermentalgiana]